MPGPCRALYRGFGEHRLSPVLVVASRMILMIRLASDYRMLVLAPPNFRRYFSAESVEFRRP